MSEKLQNLPSQFEEDYEMPPLNVGGEFEKSTEMFDTPISSLELHVRTDENGHETPMDIPDEKIAELIEKKVAKDKELAQNIGHDIVTRTERLTGGDDNIHPEELSEGIKVGYDELELDDKINERHHELHGTENDVLDHNQFAGSKK